MPPLVRVQLVFPHPPFRRALGRLVGGDPEFAVVARAATAEEGYRLADEQLPDVLLVGTMLPDAPGPTGAQGFRRRFPSVTVVLVDDKESDDGFLAAVRAGASAYCGEDVEPARLLALIKRCVNGEYVIDEQLFDKPHLAARALEEFRSATTADLAPAGTIARLTNREREVLRKVSEGMTDAGISHALGIDAPAVKVNVTLVLRKLEVDDRIQAVVAALERGWLSEGDAVVTPRPSPGDRPPGDDPPTAGRPVLPRRPSPGPGSLAAARSSGDDERRR